MLYCHRNNDPIDPCDWQHECYRCPKHGNETNQNGTLKSTLSLEEKRIVRLIKEKAQNNAISFSS